MMINRGKTTGEGPPVDRKRPISFGSRSGQAMAEFLVGLVGILVLVVGLQQISMVSMKSFEAHNAARAQVAEQLADPSSEFSGDFLFVETVNAGVDEKVYTGDDEIVQGDDSFYTEGQGFLHAVDYAQMKGYLVDYDADDPYYRLSDSSFSILSESFAMHYGVDVQPVEVLPVLRRVIGRDSVNLERDLFMPSWRGLMIQEP
jgi:hypothetical protein